jgi:hypothetical protein
VAKVSGSYESVIRGVSEQVPWDRRSGQHSEQINMISDPVRGLVRRHGSVTQDEKVIAPASAFAGLLADTLHHRAIPFSVAGVDYDLVARTRAGSGTTGFAWALNRATAKFIPIVYAAGDPVLDQLVAGGVSAATNLGRYLILAGNSIVPAHTRTDAWAAVGNQRFAAIWVRGGAFARTFAATVTRLDGTKVTATYKTKASSYPELLSTTDLLASDPEYQKKVNDRVNAYNSAATAWIGQAAEDITPENIAQKLLESFVAQGVTGVTRQRGTVLIDLADLKEVSAEDGGDNSLIHSVGNEVTAAELVSTIHRVGKIVRVRPKRASGDDAFYLEAVAKEAGSTGWAPVYWRETAGTQLKVTSAFVLGTVVGGTLYLASTVAGLTALTGLSDVPAFKPRAAGDDLTAPIPYFLGKRIDYLGTFQDRLVVGADAVLLFSRTGDYFNWFRQSVLTMADDDPVEQFALGSEDDVITGSADFDRSKIYFGRKCWYSVSGAAPMTPKTASVVKLRQEPGATAAPPQASDNLVFYCKASGEPGARSTKLHQLQAGLLADSPEGTDIAAQLDAYVVGEPLEVLPVTSPNTVFVRTTGSRQTLYVYAYLDADQGGQRLFDAWNKWVIAPQTGHVVGLSRDGSGILVYLLRQDATSTWIACERFTLASVLSPRPYLDCLRPLASSGYVTAALGTAGAVAHDTTSPYRFVGTTLDKLAQFTAAFPGAPSAWAGVGYPASVTPTNPFVLDRNGRAVVNGRLTLGRVDIGVADTGAATISVTSKAGTQQVREFSGRVIGDKQPIGTQPVVDTTVSAAIGREVRECSYTVAAVGWLPLTVSGIQWSGQYFNNTRRI